MLYLILMATKKKPTEVLSPVKTTSELPSELVVNTDNILSILEARKTVGLTIEGTLRVVKEAQGALKSTIDKFGKEHTEPDHDKRLRAALIDLELAGYIRAKGSTTDQSKHTHVNYSWGPVQLVTNNVVNESRRIDVD